MMTTRQMERGASQAAAPARRGDRLAALNGHRYCRLTTFRRSGTAVATPVWFALADGRLYIVTQQGSGKVKRLRHRAAVRVAPSTARGVVLGAEVGGQARVLAPAEAAAALRALQAKYGWRLTLLAWLFRLRRRAHVFLEIMPELSHPEGSGVDLGPTAPVQNHA